MYICSSPSHEDQLSSLSLLPLPFSFPFSFNSWLIHLVSRYIHVCIYIYITLQSTTLHNPVSPEFAYFTAQTMPRKGCKRVGFSSDVSERPPVSLRSILDPKPTSSRLRSHHKQIPARSSGSPPVRLFRYVRVNVAKALGLLRKRRPSAKCSSNMVAPQCFVPPRDSLHSETLEDCIEFINSSYRKSI